MSQFEQLLGELQAENEALTKALPADDSKDDEKIQAAAGEGGGEGAEKPAGENDDEEEEGATPFGKSLSLTDAEGNAVDAIDGTELVKSLMEEIGAIKGQVGDHESTMAKALESTLGLVKTQTALIKSLTARVDELAGKGRGRKTVLAVSEKVAAGAAPLAKSQAEEGLTAQEFLAKSEAAFGAGRITGLEFTTIDVSLRSNVAVDTALVSKVLA
jgi:hypothetical protein